ncbi:LysM peptidoglycan-binding domain-containing protein [Alcanivorax sp. NBRC 101098]|uniref:LysM peptidoglycan-binding domain-containing protein n=1 Tax=Alcanivorax sp. NBRC 101098 TaxID=1113728 RepID=UPI00062D8708|nr:LysM peptidoglycan-binding domain-containing protein [Alcanivorax sp. NBRC 101098]
MMMKSVQRALTFGLVLAVSGMASAAVVLKDGHPSKYFVKNGDTLWDISGRFLQEPWQWPEIWQINEEISNPHLIYPGDEIRLSYVDGEPRLSVKRGVEETVMSNGTVKLTPRVREIANDQAIPAIPASAIQSYLKEGLVVDRQQIIEAPYLVGGRDRRVIFGEGDTVYARDTKTQWEGLEQGYGFYRTGEQYVDPDTNEVLGYEARQIGLGRVSSHDDDMISLRVTDSSEDLRIDDRLFSTEDRRVRAVLYPSAPDTKIEAKVIRFFDRLNSVARNDVVVINKGLRDGLKEGNVLDIYGQGEVVRDRQQGDMVQLPRERTGSMVIFRVFDKVSYSLIMESTRPIYMNDIAESPAGSY